MRSWPRSRGTGFRGCRQIPTCHQKDQDWGGIARAYLGDSVLNHLLVGHIALVADEQLVHAFGGITVNFLEPLLHVVE